MYDTFYTRLVSIARETMFSELSYADVNPTKQEELHREHKERMQGPFSL